MHQNTCTGYIICMIIRNLEIVDFDGTFKELVLDFLDNNIFAVDEDEDIAGTKMHRRCPAFDR